MSNEAMFKVGDVVVRTVDVDCFKYGSAAMKIVGFDKEGNLLFAGEEGDKHGWTKSSFKLVHSLHETIEQQIPDRKLRLTEMQKEAIQAGISALYRHEESLKEQSYDPSLTYRIEICKYQQEVLRSMLREVNR